MLAAVHPSTSRAASQPARLGSIYAQLAEVSARPRYAFLVLGLIAEAALATGKTNVSRAVSDLVRAGLVKPHYAGDFTDHFNRGGRNRGGRRLAVFAVTAEAMAAVRTRALLL